MTIETSLSDSIKALWRKRNVIQLTQRAQRSGKVAESMYGNHNKLWGQEGMCINELIYTFWMHKKKPIFSLMYTVSRLHKQRQFRDD